MISFDINNDLIHIRLHCEQVYSNLVPMEHIINTHPHQLDYKIRGIYQHSLGEKVVEGISNSLKNVRMKIVVFDFRLIYSIRRNVLIELRNCIDTMKASNECYCVNIEKNVQDSFKKMFEISNMEFDSDLGYYSSNKVTGLIGKCQSLIAESEKEFDRQLIMKLIKCTDRHGAPSPSSRVILKKYVNIKHMLEDISFLSLAIYKLAIKLCEDKKLDQHNYDNNRHLCFFTHTMNGTVIGALLAQLFCINILFVDHLGPYNKVFAYDLIKRIESDKQYIVVTDVVCMGTELNNAITILDVFGVQYRGCVTLLDIDPLASFTQKNHYGREWNMTALFTVNKNNNQNTIQYVIETDF